MKIYLLNPPYYKKFSRSMRFQETCRGGTIHYPFWLAYATALLEKDHKVKLLDAPACDWDVREVAEDVSKFRPSMLVVETNFTSWRNDLKIAEDIKKVYSDSTVVVVGPPTALFSELFLASQAVDVVVRGEYDFKLFELAKSVEGERGYDDVPGISYKDGKEVVNNPDIGVEELPDLDTIPFVSKVYKKHFNIRDYFISSSLYPEVQIISGRGCPHHCVFCAWPQLFTGRKVRMRSPGNVIDEMEWIRDNLPEVKEIVFEDDTFTIDRKWVLEFCDGVKERELDVAWSGMTRADLSYEILKKMREAGCRKLIGGFESGSDTILVNIKKGITSDRMMAFSRDVKKAGILLQGDFILGLPGENKETLKVTSRFINEIKPEILQVAIATPYPGTEFYDWAKENGYLTVDDPTRYLDEKGHQISVLSYPDLPKDEIDCAVDKTLKGYYMSPKYVPLFIRQVLRENGLDEFIRLTRAMKVFLRYLSRGGK